MLAPVQDFATASRVMTELSGRQAQIVDGEAGVRGFVDSEDILERTTKTGRTSRVELGEERFNDVAFRVSVINAARDLAASGAEFSPDSKSDRVNDVYWTLGYGGRIGARKFMADGTLGSPAAAVRDVFANGKAYAFECATAMMLIFHKAILDSVGDEAFDAMFTDPGYLKIFRWDLKDNDYLDLEEVDNTTNELIPGNHYYYRNPDASEENSAFNGENVIYIGTRNGERLFYAHGIVGQDGTYLVTEKEVLETLSSLRKEGAKTEPFRAEFMYSLNPHRLARKLQELELN